MDMPSIGNGFGRLVGHCKCIIKPTTSIDKRRLQAIFKRADMNNSKSLSYGELDQISSELWPDLAHSGRAKMLAFKHANAEGTPGAAGRISLREFPKFLQLLSFYHQLRVLFELVDTDDDRRLSFEEFKSGASAIGFVWHHDPAMNEKFALHQFVQLNSDDSELLSFDEFCKWAHPSSHGDSEYLPAASQLPASRSWTDTSWRTDRSVVFDQIGPGADDATISKLSQAFHKVALIDGHADPVVAQKEQVPDYSEYCDRNGCELRRGTIAYYKRSKVILRFMGRVHFSRGVWAGIEVVTGPQARRAPGTYLRGRHDGSVDGVHYFRCPDRRGIFVRPRELILSSRDNV